MSGGVDILPVLLCGGSGSRLWPTSRELYPKQLLPLGSEAPLAVETARRAGGDSFRAPLVICNEEHRFLIAALLQEAGITCGDIVLEPAGRNTAAPACIAAHYAAALADGGRPAPVVALLPADHLIADAAAFQGDLRRAAAVAEDTGSIVTFGITPERPETGYGYIKAGAPLGEAAAGARAVERFVEKPDAETAAGYLKASDYYWNSGIFVYAAATLLAEAERADPALAAGTQAALEAARRDLDFLRLDADAFRALPNVSIDTAIMEKTARAAVLPASFGWSDIGSWHALWEQSPRDDDGNALVGDVIARDSVGSYIRNDTDSLTVAIGVRDTVVIATDDAILVCDRTQSQKVKDIVGELKAQGRGQWQTHRTVHRPWGSFRTLAAGPRYQVKEIVVKPGAALSLQYHHHRAEHWVVVEGTAEVTRGDATLTISENQSTYIALGETHRLRNPGAIPVRLIEVQSGAYLGEDDIVRLADDYAREG